MKKSMRRKRNRGFTLLEVLMVVIIIGLLAVFVVPQFFGTEDKAKRDLTQSKVTSGLNGTIDRFRFDMGVFPTTDEGLKALLQRPDNEDAAKKWGGPYLKSEEDLKDAWGRDLIYEAPGRFNESSYDLSSPGKDGQTGTEDDITNWKKT